MVGVVACICCSCALHPSAIFCPSRWLRLYTDTGRVSAPAKDELEKEGVVLRPYGDVSSDLQLLLSWEMRNHLQQQQQKEDERQKQEAQEQRQAGLVAAVDCLLSGADGRLQKPSPKLKKQEALEAQQAAWLDPKINLAIHRIVSESRRLIVKDTPVAVAKVCSARTLQRRMLCPAEIELTLCTSH